MAFPEYSLQSKELSSYLIDIRQAIESSAEASAKTGKELSDTTQALRSDFNWALMLISGRLEEQTDLLRSMTVQLEALQHTLDSPLVTQARELFRIGQDLFN